MKYHSSSISRHYRFPLNIDAADMVQAELQRNDFRPLGLRYGGIGTMIMANEIRRTHPEYAGRTLVISHRTRVSGW